MGALLVLRGGAPGQLVGIAERNARENFAFPFRDGLRDGRNGGPLISGGIPRQAAGKYFAGNGFISAAIRHAQDMIFATSVTDSFEFASRARVDGQALSRVSRKSRRRIDSLYSLFGRRIGEWIRLPI